MSKNTARGTSAQTMWAQLFSRYMERVSHGAQRHCLPESGLYHGAEGCHRFANECGYAMRDFERSGIDVDSLLKSTYSGICVIAYGLKPPVDAGAWIEWMREGLEKARKYDEEHSTEQKDENETEEEPEDVPDGEPE